MKCFLKTIGHLLIPCLLCINTVARADNLHDKNCRYDPKTHKFLSPALNSRDEVPNLQKVFRDGEAKRGAIFHTATVYAVPQLASMPGAPATLFLEFGGPSIYDTVPTTYCTASYNNPFDLNGDSTTFTSGEVEAMTSIWQRISEFYSPFKINVTTIDPGNRNAYQTATVRITSGSGMQVGGWAYVYGFASSSQNTGCVFPDLLGNNEKIVADAAGHEAGHLFGLGHQGRFNGADLTQEYNDGDSEKGPIMGMAYFRPRSLWWYGQSSWGSTSWQDDLVGLAQPLSGYRTDDYADTLSGAATMTVSGLGTASLSGVLTTTSDVDMFKVNHSSGSVLFSAVPYSPGGMADLVMSLYDSGGSLIETVNPTNTTSVQRTLNRADTATYVAISSAGLNIGDIGQYTFSSTVLSVTGGVPTPTQTPIPTASATPVPPTPTRTATDTPSPLPTLTVTSTPTRTPTPLAPTLIPTRTSTPVSSVAPTAVPTATVTPLRTVTRVATSVPDVSSTPTPKASHTPIGVPVVIRTPAREKTPTPSPTPTKDFFVELTMVSPKPIAEWGRVNVFTIESKGSDALRILFKGRLVYQASRINPKKSFIFKKRLSLSRGKGVFVIEGRKNDKVIKNIAYTVQVD